MGDYSAEYLKTMAALDAALRKRDQIDTEIDSLQNQAHAWQTLLQTEEGPVAAIVEVPTKAAARLTWVAKPQLTERVRGLLTFLRVPLTTGEIIAELKRANCDLRDSANQWALVHGICRRLVQQGFAQEVDKAGKKAWVVIKKIP